jgi:3-dehydroquinate synthase
LKTLSIRSKLKNYVVTIHKDTETISTQGPDSRLIYIVDSRVWKLHRNDLLKNVRNANIIFLDASEGIKSLATVQELYKDLLIYEIQRATQIVVIGGGVIQDVSGFVASTIYRGIDWTFIPTTLLAQVDSCIGGKSSLNFMGYKNLLGTFFPPSKIDIYPEFLTTLHIEDFYSGLGEIVKLHIVAGKEKYSFLKSEVSNFLLHHEHSVFQVICSSLETKKKFIEEDEFDVGNRRFLNYGHCFGHAIEASSEFRIPHGQAVIIGMLLANLVSLKRNVLSRSVYDDLIALLFSCLLSKPKKEELATKLIINGLINDKKRSGSKLALILLKDNFEMELIQDMEEMEVHFALKELQKLLDL